MTKLVRVRNHKTGHQYSLSPKAAEQRAKKGEVEILSGKAATDVNGRPLPAKTLQRSAVIPTAEVNGDPAEGRTPNVTGDPAGDEPATPNATEGDPALGAAVVPTPGRPKPNTTKEK